MDRVGDYVFLRELGRGEHSHVYLARTPRRLGIATDAVAVKVLSLPGTDGFDAVVDDLTLFAGLGSPHLLPLYDVGTDAGVVFYAMRYQPLGSLSAPAQELTRREQLRAVAAAARGAHELHEAGLAHRGIGPANVLLDRAGAVLAEPAVGHLLTHGHTLSGLGPRAQAGGLELVDPLLMQGRPAGRASDIWSLGVTLHLVLTGHGLFPALVSADPFTAVRIYLRSHPEPGEDLTDGERAVVVTAVHPDPARRYRTAGDLADAVEDVARRPGG
ncbi:protein kinase domain-containing protein [Geodermatophilus sabuli]|uniref:non-specific serine/threonine protein kinase n=1 Tax=Geodermatophilus sabuli TaxID=1564158 RepID=A0A285EEZ1_9ACTN|nr:protein kinase [Geodermatophilus sabuli]MBB3086236.1 serine/threonine-protein kinase [Geodermatophilus sabuli]SNX97547.1 Serine/threonine protein kinase [Geodermatophilus sabuli]